MAGKTAVTGATGATGETGETGATCDWTIRRLVDRDLEAYKQLRDESLDRHPTAFTSDAAEAVLQAVTSYRSRFGDDRSTAKGFTLGAFLTGGALAGAVSCEREQRIKARHVAHLTAMMVRSEAAGRGIGGDLLRAAIELLRAAPGVAMVTLNVTSTNHAAVTLYEQAGFVRYGSLADAIRVEGRGYTKDQMVLRLQPPAP